ncbi:hypothetical protein AD935_13525 [Gluconobacter japonicus]|nr:hypothetical protein AD935_13525 [Gluconobacter japonicus]
MSQILPSTHVGEGQSWASVSVGAQLASTERFQDFLKSYVHTAEEPAVNRPARKNVVQDVEKKAPDPSAETRRITRIDKNQSAVSSGGENRVGLGSQVNRKASAPAELRADIRSIQSGADKRVAVPIATGSSVSSEEHMQVKPSSRQEGLQSDPSTPSVDVDNISASFAGKGASDQTFNFTTQISAESEQVPPSQSVLKQNLVLGGGALAVTLPSEETISSPIASNDLSAEKTLDPEDNFFVSEQSSEQENMSFSETVSSLSDASVPHARMEISDVANGRKEETHFHEPVSGRSEVRVAPVQDMLIISHASADRRLNTEIAMSLGESGKVHVSIEEAEDGERHVHIRAENPDVLQSLADDKERLFAILNQSIIPISTDQPVIPTDLTLSLMGNFSQNSENGSAQERHSITEDAEHPASSSISRNTTQASIQSSQRMLRSVVDLTA